jgi:hypothetical protein
MMGLLRFVFYFSLFALAVLGIALGLASLFEEKILLSPNFIPIFIFLYFLTIIVYFLALWGMKKGAEYSVYSVLGGIVIKMILSLSLIFYLFLKSPENQKVLALNFFSMYFLFTLFEVTVLLCNLRDQNKK